MNAEGEEPSAETIKTLRKKQRWTDVANMLTISAGVLTSVVTFVVWYEGSLQKRESLRDLSSISEVYLRDAIEKQSATTSGLAAQIKELQNHLASLSNIPKEGGINITIQKLSTSLDDLSSRENRLESVIMQNPAKALEVPLLRRDLDSQKDAQQIAFSALKDSVDRIYDLNKWLLGAMAISIVTLAVGNLLRPKEAKP